LAYQTRPLTHKSIDCSVYSAVMEMDRFNRYEENFLNSSRIISRCINQLDSANGVVDVIISASVEIDGEIAEAEGYLRAMDVEFRTMSSMEKKNAQTKLTDYREELRQLQGTYNSAKSGAESLAIRGAPSSRAKLLNANQRLDQSTATLEQSRQMLAKTQVIGDTVLSDLESQKDTLMDAQSRVHETRSLANDAKRILRSMGQRAILHKICVAFTILVLAGAIVAVGYYGVMKK